MVTYVCKSYCYIPRGENKSNNLSISSFTNLLDEEKLKKLELGILKDDVSSNLLFWRSLPGDYKDSCLLVIDL